jgi:hypothetical protein
MMDRSNIDEHFARFAPTDKYGNREEYVVVDINYNLQGAPRQEVGDPSPSLLNLCCSSHGISL